MRTRHTQHYFPRAAAGLVTLLALFLASAITPTNVQAAVVATTLEASPTTVTADALPTWQINGVVWSQVVIGNTVYATGEFSEARPPGVARGGPGSVTVSNLIAYDIRTGVPISTFNHSLNAQGLVITKSPDGSKIYVGGDFTTVDGEARGHIAAFDTATGAMDPSFHPSIDGQVKAITASDSTVYAGGAFYAAGGKARTCLAAFDASTGALLSWAPSTDSYYVWSMVMTPDQSKVVVGGQFEKISSLTVNGMTAVDASTGAVLPWAANQTIVDYKNGAVTGLSTDGQEIYGSGWAFGSGGRFEGEFSLDPDTGAINWLNDCQGDTYDTWPMDGVLYTVSHVHNCEMIGELPQLSDPHIYGRTSLAFSTTPTKVNNGPDMYGWNYKGIPASKIMTWFPDVSWGNYTQYGQSGWSVTGNGDYLALGGEFLAVNGIGQQGLVRFAVHKNAPNKMGPEVGYGSTTPSVTSRLGGTAVVSWNAAYDPDDTMLTYQVYRSGSTTPVYSTTHDGALPWDVPRMNFVDTGLSPGSTQTYTIKVSDPDGNTLTLARTNIVTIASGTPSPYAIMVLQNGAGAYWRLDEPSGSTVMDWAGSNNAVAQTGVSRGTTGAILDDPDAASTFNGSNSGYAAAQTQLSGPNTFSVEAWFKTTTNQGGKIIGFGNALSGNSKSYDRHVYMDNNGRLWFGVYAGGAQTVNTSASYNDGQWHQIVTSLGPDGMHLYVDGALQAERSDVTTAQAYSGYWRIGGDNLNGWAPRPRSDYFAGAIDEASVYPNVLTPQQVADQYSLATTGTVPNQPPRAAFTFSVNNLAVSFDGSSSTDPDGTISSYAWDFGDNSAAGSGVKPDHTYTSAGTYTVMLTVTDNDGGTNPITNAVTVVANKAPVAAFSSSVGELNASFDGSGSADPDGSISSYVWDFGDGSAAASGAKRDHTYAKAGTYTVELTVTDNGGATNSVSHEVTVTQPGAAIVVDDFNRTVDNGLGSADQGGSWTLLGSASKFSVDGTTGQLRLIAAGTSTNAFLDSVSASDVDLSVDVALDKAPKTTSVYTSAVVRSQGTDTYYLVKLRWLDTGGVEIYLTRMVNGSESILAGGGVAGLSAQDTLTVRFQVSRRSPTTLKTKVWKAGSGEPSTWKFTATDSTAALQTAGGIGLVTYLSGMVTNAPIVASFDNLTVYPPDEAPAAEFAGPQMETGKAPADRAEAARADTAKTDPETVKAAPAAPNRAPTAAFTASADDLTVALDATGSEDVDGSIVSYAWDFGDESSIGTTAKAKHTYAEAGTHAVTLTVTDNDGAVKSIKHNVTVAAPDQPGPANMLSP